MPVKKQEAHRALELLEDYHSRLSAPQDRALRIAIERVIRIFKSRLFQALLAQKMNLRNYFIGIQRSFDSQDGFLLGGLISLQDPHVLSMDLVNIDVDLMLLNSSRLEPPLDEIVGHHLNALKELQKVPRNVHDAYKQQTGCVQGVVKLLQALKEENWCLPVMFSACLDLRLLAQKCEESGNISKPGEILEKAAEGLMACFRVCTADNRSADEDTKRHGMLNLVNQLFKVYFRINKLHLCKPLIRAIESSAFKDTFPLEEQITYKYFVGRKAMFDSDYKCAEEYLTFAFEMCPKIFIKNKRLILIYLVPVKMLLGYMPKQEILKMYDVLQFYELACALREGNVRKFDDVIAKHEAFFIKFGIYLLVEKLKIIAYRNLFKKVYLIMQTHQLDLQHFVQALEFVGTSDINMDETQCILANLIYEGKIKGYISYQHNKLVVSKQNPFPTLTVPTM